MPPRRRRKPHLEIRLQIGSRAIRAPTPAQVRRWARAALQGSAEVTVRVVGTAEARRLNRRYRGEDRATNVLSFPYLRSRSMVQGDIVLCAPVIAREARFQGKTLESHFAHMTVHAMLHLQGHDHLRPSAAGRMETLEKRLLAKLGYPDPYDAAR